MSFTCVTFFRSSSFSGGSVSSWVQSPTSSATKIRQAGKFTTRRPPSNMHRKTEEATLLFTMGIATFSGASSKHARHTVACPLRSAIAPDALRLFCLRPERSGACLRSCKDSCLRRFAKNARQAQTPAIQAQNFHLGNLASP